MKKRIISLLMALLMLTSLLPTAVWAEGEAPEQAAAAATDSTGNPGDARSSGSSRGA